MTGFKSKKAMAQDKLDSMERKRGSIALARQLCYQIAGATNGEDDFSGNDYGSVDIAEILSAEVVRLQAALAQPAQEPVREALKLALEALEWCEPDYYENPKGLEKWADVMPILRAALSQPAQDMALAAVKETNA